MTQANQCFPRALASLRAEAGLRPGWSWIASLAQSCMAGSQPAAEVPPPPPLLQRRSPFKGEYEDPAAAITLLNEYKQPRIPKSRLQPHRQHQCLLLSETRNSHLPLSEGARMNCPEDSLQLPHLASSHPLYGDVMHGRQSRIPLSQATFSVLPHLLFFFFFNPS